MDTPAPEPARSDPPKWAIFVDPPQPADPAAAAEGTSTPPELAPQPAPTGMPERSAARAAEPPIQPPVIPLAAPELPPLLPRMAPPPIAAPPGGSAALPPPVNPAPPPPPAPDVPAGAGWATLVHLSTLVTFVPWNPFGQLLGMVAPLLVWQMGGARDRNLEEHAKRAFDFQFTVFLARWALTLACCLCCLAWPVFFLWNIALTLWVAIEAANGRTARYPLSLRLLARRENIGTRKLLLLHGPRRGVHRGGRDAVGL